MVMYALVIVKSRRRVDELYYQVPQKIIPFISVGSQVVVPILSRTVRGIVYKITRRLPSHLRGRTKPIAKVVPGIKFTSRQLRLVDKLSSSSAATLAEAAFLALGKPWKKEPLGRDQGGNAKPLFIQAAPVKRFEMYIQLAKRFPSQQFLVIFAQNSFLGDFLQRNLPPNISAGTIKDIFKQLTEGDFLIIDQPSHIGARFKLRPYFDATFISEIRAEAERLRLVFGDVLPRPDQYQKITEGKWRVYKEPVKPMNLTIFSGPTSQEMLLESTARQISQTVDRGGRVLILVAAKGHSQALMCLNCRHIFKCNRCKRPIAVQISHLKCRYCANEQDKPSICPVCAAGNLKSLGFGASKLTELIKRRFERYRVQELSGDSVDLRPDSQIVVATEKIFSYSSILFEASFILDPDRFLAGTNIEASWRLFYQLLLLKNCSKSLSVQTTFAEHPIWVEAASESDNFLRRIIAERKKYRLPPFVKTVEFIGHFSARSDTEAEVEKLKEFAAQHFQEAEFPDYEITRQSAGRLTVSQHLLCRRLSLVKLRLLRQELPPKWFPYVS